MTNNFYNVNIHRYNPAESRGNYAVQNSDGSVTNPNQQTAPPQVELTPEQKEQWQSHARLNALDSTLLENEAYQNMDNEVFKKEYKISRIEESIKAIDDEIERAKAIEDFQKADILIMRKHNLQAQLKELNQDYGSSDLTTKLSGNLTSMMSKKPTFFGKVIDNCVSFMSGKVLPRISKKFDSGRTIKTALNKLETLNKNVDELVTMQTPYGEADERYDMLGEYLNQANVIHFNISKTVGTPTFFDTISSIDKEKFIAEAKKNQSNFGNMTNRPKNAVEIPE